ncbi:NADPH:quinone reductase [Nakamurella sp.]|uniref:NADPH:quinone reductase n=1 Tax=Nakamurella sp. TaxID=1869182 RepID=UPI00378334C5
MTTTRRAAYVEQRGPADSIRVGPLPVPDLGPDDVLVAVTAVSVNPVDTYVRSGRYDTPIPLPFIIGRDLVGTVAAVGPAVRGLAVGDAVWANSLGHAGRQGAATDLAVVPRERLYRLPDGVDPEVAVAVAHPAVTAYLGWFLRARIRPGWTVFVGGGAGNVGISSIQMAVRAGVRVIASARDTHADRCRAAGADAVVDYRAGDLADQIAAHAPDGIDVYWDTSGTNDTDLAAAVLKPGGRMLVTAARTPVTVALAPLYTHDVTIDGFVISRASATEFAQAAELINAMLAAGALTTRITRRLPLDRAAEAHRLLEAGEVDGRLLLTI